MQPVRVYVGTYTLDGRGEGIYVYDLDIETGRLSHAATISGLTNPSYLALSPQGDFLYAVLEVMAGEETAGRVGAFAVDRKTGGLTPLNEQSSHGLSPCHLSVDAGGYVLVANYDTGSLCVLPILPDGRLDHATDVFRARGVGPHPRQDHAYAHMITPSPEGRFYFAVDLGTDRITGYRLDRVRGRLVPLDSPQTALRPGTGPRHLVFHPGGHFAYVVGELNNTVTVLAYDADRGMFEERQVISTLPEGFTGRSHCAAIRVAPAGRFVYASNRGHDSIAIFAVDEETGLLAATGHASTQGNTPRDFAIDPSGRFLLVANQDSGAVVTLRVDPDTGQLADTGIVTEAPMPVCICFALVHAAR